MSDLFAVLLGAALGLLESVPGVGALAPGEATITALTVTLSGWWIPLLALAVAAGAATGDQLGYWCGRRGRDRIAGSRLVQRVGLERWENGLAALRRRGSWAVLLTRLLPGVRALVPAAAGAAGLSAPRFTSASLVGCAVWSALWVGAGSLALRLASAHTLPVIATCSGVLLLLVAWRVRCASRSVR